MPFQNRMGEALRNVIESKGEDFAAELLYTSLESKKMGYHDVSIREIWEACQLAAGLSTNVQEAVVSSAFPKLTGELINSRLISAYNGVAMIGDNLCTIVPSNMENETIGGITDTGTPDTVTEMGEYPKAGVSEKYVTARNLKRGIMIEISEEVIRFDKTGQILQRCMRIGQKTAQFRERLILRGVQDLDTDVYYPSGVATSVYSSTNGNLKTTNPFGESGMEEIRKLIQLQKDDSPGWTDDDFIYIDPDNLSVLVPADLEVEAWQLAMSAKTPESSENAENFFKGRFKAFSSPYITNASSTTWYYGDFKNAFWWMEVYPLQVLTQPTGSDDQFKYDIKSRHKVRFFGNLTCVEPKLVYKSTA